MNNSTFYTMKKLSFFVAAVAAIVSIASCEKEKPLEDLNPTVTESAVTIESGKTIQVNYSLNDVRGNVITVKCDATPTEGFTVENTIDNTNYESGYVTVTAPELILDETPFDINLSFTDATNSRVAATKITVNPKLIDGLVKFTEPANSFVVAPGSIVVFPTCKGNSAEKVQPYAIVPLWQDTQSLFASSPKIMDGEAIVTFKEGLEGNVVVVAVDQQAKILWSWHFWVVSDTPKDVTVGDYTFMDRNIGALNLDEKSELSVGVVYQYGRKDPFPGIKFGEYAMRTIYDATGNETEITIVKNEEQDNLANAIANPSTYYNNVYVSGAKHGYSWVTVDAPTYGADAFKALWDNGGSKTMYDPCPAGYVVAPKAAWDAVKTAATDVKELWDDSYETFDDTAIGTNAKYATGNKKKVQFRGCVYDGLRLTITGEINSNSTKFAFANCIGKALPTAEVWMSDIDPDFASKLNASYFRGMAVKVNTTGNGNNDDISAIKVNALNTAAKYGLNYALPVRCIKEKK